MWDGRDRVAIVGVGHSRLLRNSDEPVDTYMREATEAAIADAGIAPSDIDGAATYPGAPYVGAVNREGYDRIGVEYALDSGLVPGPLSWYSEVSGGLITAAVIEAVNALLSEACTYAIVWRAMRQPPSKALSASGPASGNDQFTLPYGCASPVQWHALVYRRYLEKYGRNRNEMAGLATALRDYATSNPHAFFNDQPMTVEDYETAPLVSDPIGLFDCDIPVSGCVVMILTTTDRARQLEGSTRALVSGFAMNGRRQPLRINYAFGDYMDLGGRLGADLWSSSGMSANDMSSAQVYDGFSPSAVYWLESLGFCEEGAAFDFIEEGNIGRDGSLPLNTAGGSLSQGRLHGMGHLAEAVLQVSGLCGDRQIPSRGPICVFTGSPMMRAAAMVVSPDHE